MPSIDPDTALKLARQVAEIYGEGQSSMLKKVSQRLANGVDQPGWAEAKQAQVRRIRHEALVDIRRLEKFGPDAVQQVIEESYGIGVEAAKAEREVSISSSFIGSNRAAVEALAKETIGAVTSTHTQILRSSVDMYRRTIAETMAQTLTGTQTRREAAQAAMDKFAGRGITGFVDKAGRNWRLESYTEMATRTGSGHAMIEGRLQTYQAAGRDLVIVSDAPEECPWCRQYEGKVLSISGKSSKHQSVASARAGGLLHPGCRHDLRPYIEGLTKRFTNTSDPEGDKLRNQQRYMERQVREKKRQVLSAEQFGDSPLLAKRQTQLAGAQKKLTGFIDEHDRKRLRYREQISRAI